MELYIVFNSAFPRMELRDMKDYFSSWAFTTGFALLVLGNAPLLAIIFLSKIGAWPDPNPNPIGFGLLSFVTFWPGVLLIALGALRVRARRRNR